MPDDAGAVAAVVLAAGSSRRMGQNKLLLRMEGETLVARVARRAAAAGLNPVIVVLGHEAERVRLALEGVACRTVVNDGHARGQASSFRAGIAALPEATRAAVVLLADMPRVTVEMIAALVARYREAPAPLVISEYEGVAAPPTLYDRSLFSDILSSDTPGRDVVRRHRASAGVVQWPADRLADLDEPADLERFAPTVNPG
jgi:molybdenum cofactor cytidylyltransferase